MYISYGNSFPKGLLGFLGVEVLNCQIPFDKILVELLGYCRSFLFTYIVASKVGNLTIPLPKWS